MCNVRKYSREKDRTEIDASAKCYLLTAPYKNLYAILQENEGVSVAYHFCLQLMGVWTNQRCSSRRYSEVCVII